MLKNGKHSGAPLIQMRGVTKTFKTSAGVATVLKQVDADFYAGEFVSVVGRSGSGKSTLVNMITGIDHPSSGSVRVGDTLLHGMSEGKMSTWRGLNLGIVFQFYQLLPMLTILENVMVPMDICNKYQSSERVPRAMELLRRVGLEELAHKLPAAISGGQQQSAAIGRALANDPPIIIADEPTGNLDSRTAESVMVLFEELVGQGKTILMVTHDPDLARRATRILLISDGELVDEAITRALPDLPHARLLELTHLAERRVFEPGALILPSGKGKPSSAILAKGRVEVVQAARHGAKQAQADIINNLTPGCILERAQVNGCELRASAEGIVEVLFFAPGVLP
jgi:putative ABC transport system ATP-binding protein